MTVDNYKRKYTPRLASQPRHYEGKPDADEDRPRERIERQCLSCEKKFIADSRFLRLCWLCRR